MSLYCISSNALNARIKTTAASGNSAGLNFVGGATNADWTLLTNRGDLTANASDIAFYKNAGTAGIKLVIQNSGNLGIGTTSPSGLLAVRNTGTGFTTYIEDESNDTSPFVIDANGNIGIGLTNPKAKKDNICKI